MMDWTARDGNGSAMDGSVSRDGSAGSRWDWLGNGRLGVARWIGRLAMGRRLGNGGLGVAPWIGQLAMGMAWQWTAWRCAMDWMAGNRQWMARDVLAGLRWDDELGNGRLGVARWIGRLVMGRLGNGRLGVAQWIRRLVIGRARQWMARRRAMNMNWTACDGLDARTG